MVTYQVLQNPVGNFLIMLRSLEKSFSQIQNAQNTHKLNTKIKHSKFILEILVVLRKEGFIRGFSVTPGYITVLFKYLNNKPVFTNISIISKSSRRVFFKASTVQKKKLNGGLFVFTTSSGVKSNHTVLDKGIGGEVIFYIS